MKNKICRWIGVGLGYRWQNTRLPYLGMTMSGDFELMHSLFRMYADDIFMAYLGLADQAREYLVKRASTYDKNSRFPAFWGPNYDWVPDQDHGGVMMKALQSMLLQADPYSDKLYLLPAWPKAWNADFKLHAPGKTVIEGSVREGKVENLKVTPTSRRKDIILKPLTP
jgi:hypothetical protein